ncbi:MULTISPECIES: hypothetical protein [Okeania]|uniref:hypothetical protein n=1 Tax=Okeania TaxID=1458928 RepID=UPI000F54844D|nr:MULTISPECIES: hypothetical protein [Okeania]NEP04354.1 hypothetical protein [Okeania sp. SIO4D6]NEP73718.1 hypothetical protein [Okeania sp. SIO2G5]NEP96213.1 hypothetical protein [Okeania sp. SIO2F5]NEQ92265.1 hypothetical protein [Okeania sp. SIO2G4]NES89408.1 hypothetical protein [Okeania sp. SIO2B9]
MNYSFIQAIPLSENNLFEGCRTISWLMLGEILCNGNDFGIDYGGLELLEKFNHIFQIEGPNIRSNQFLRSGRYRPKKSVHKSD